jgi:SAM-dependent methyltransferase
MISRRPEVPKTDDEEAATKNVKQITPQVNSVARPTASPCACPSDSLVSGFNPSKIKEINSLNSYENVVLGTVPSPDVGGKEVASYFQAAAQTWHTMYVRKDVWGCIHQQRLATFMAWVDKLGLPPGTRVFDSGCGAGMATVALAQRGYFVDSIDVAPSMIEFTRRNVTQAGVGTRVNANVGDIYNISFPDQSFDLVLSIGVIPWLQSPGRAIAELARVTKPGGYLLFTADNRWRLARLVDPSTSPALALPKRLIKRIFPSLHFAPAPQNGVPSYLHSLKDVDAFLSSTVLERIHSATLGFGPFTFFHRSFFPARVGVTIHRALQYLADLRLPIIRSVGAQFLVLARKR